MDYRDCLIPADAMASVGISKPEDIILYLPARYHDYRKAEERVPVSGSDGNKVYLHLRLIANPFVDRDKKPSRVTLKLTDGVSEIYASVFGNLKFGKAKDWASLKEGSFHYFYGKVDPWNNQLQLKSADIVPLHHQNKITAFYKKPKKKKKNKGCDLSPEDLAGYINIMLRSSIDDAVRSLETKIGVPEASILNSSGIEFNSLKEFLSALHMPADLKQLKKALKGVRSLGSYHLLLKSASNRRLSRDSRSSIKIDVTEIKRLLAQLPFELTVDQKKAIWSIVKDLRSDFPMDRLLSGDVGCGKTLAYAIPAVCAHMQSKQVVILINNEVLAAQVHREILTSFSGVSARLILGGEHEEIDAVSSEILIGTSALINKILKMDDSFCVDLYIVDEQQKIGNDQKLSIARDYTNILEATATAIPKTMALVNYGGKDVSVIEKQPVEKTVSSYVVGLKEKKRVFNKLKKIVQSGHQIAIVYPRRVNSDKKYIYHSSFIGDDRLLKLKEGLLERGVTLRVSDSDEGVSISYSCSPEKHVSILDFLGSSFKEVEYKFEEQGIKGVEEAAEMWSRAFPGRVGMIHGGLKSDEKISVIERMKDGELDIIITSTVIEIGLTMPALRGCLVVDADVYGTSTLHQLRGRLARHGGSGVFLMSVGCNKNDLPDKAKERLGLLLRYNKGSELAHEDMVQRGFGDLSRVGDKQAGHVDSLFPGVKILHEHVSEFIESNKTPYKTA